jgi:hypothetical protein
MAKRSDLLTRTAILLLVSPVLGSIFALASLLGMADPGVFIMAPFATGLGFIIGAAMSPLPALCLQRGPLRQALAFVGISTSIAAMLGGWFGPMTPYPAVWAGIAYIASCLSWLVFSLFLPAERHATTNTLVCPCGYDLTGLESTRCPECGSSFPASNANTPDGSPIPKA